MTTRAEAIARAVARLTGAGVETPERDARLLYRWAAGLDGPGLTAAISDPARPAELARFEQGVVAREGRMPLSHITGTREFWGRPFAVGQEVLDPRPETETLIAAALENPATRILDLGTGSGCILGTLLSERPEATGIGTDISMEALQVAAANLERLGLAHRVELLRTDWLDGVEGPFDLVVSNPPYIAFEQIASLAPEVRDYEPLAALTPGGDGLGAYRRIAADVARVIAPGGRLIVEIGEGQADAVSDIFARASLALRGTREDMDGRPRVVIATVR